jgi:uncharacterized membrane protein SpoIIM required for sporulation
MLDSIINPKEAEKGPWKMFFVGLIYASLSIFLVYFFFKEDPVFGNGLMVVIFSVMFSLPFMYYLSRREEKQDEQVEGFVSVWKVHYDALFALMWLFIGFIIAFSFWHIVLQSDFLLNAQIKTYCQINSPGNVAGCIGRYSFGSELPERVSRSIPSFSQGFGTFLAILENNIYVMILTLLFSLIFGAGAIFILAWNASVIAAAIGIFTRYNIKDIPFGLVRYMIHGIPEIGAYFVAALAGGMFGFGVLKNGFRSKMFLRVLENVVLLLVIAIVLLIIAAGIEVYFTPLLF